MPLAEPIAMRTLAVDASKYDPSNVTCVPPIVGPLLGEIDVIFGPVVNIQGRLYLRDRYPATRSRSTIEILVSYKMNSATSASRHWRVPFTLNPQPASECLSE